MRRHRAPILILLLIAGITAANPLRQARAKSISDKDEIALGKHIAHEAEMRFGPNLTPKSPVAQRVRRIGMSLSRLSSRKSIPYSYSVVDNAEILNAFALPGGPIFITQKLVKFTQNDAELTYILAHETAHVERRHSIKTLERMQKAQRVAAAFGRHWLGGHAVQGILSAGAAITYVLWSLSYSREQEMEADLIGVRWMSRLGYDPRAAIHILSRMETKYPASGSMPRYLSSHPLPRIRRARILALINDEKLLQVAQQHGGPRLWTNGPALPLPKPQKPAVKATATPTTSAPSTSGSATSVPTPATSTPTQASSTAPEPAGPTSTTPTSSPAMSSTVSP